MKDRVLTWLRCPDCRGDKLSMVSFAVDPHSRSTCNPETHDGVLTCCCKAWFPIIDGVPRLLPRHLRDVLQDEYPAFFRQYAGRLCLTARENPPTSPEGKTEGQIKIMESFGYEWNEFEDYDNNNFDMWLAPLRPEFFRGKVGLDAGCGGGRHALKAHSYGAEVIAMDLSPAVDAAYKKARTTSGVHVVQGDIFNPPLAPRSFDFIYSLGVLHHTPDPPEAFQRLVPLLRPGAVIAAMVYANGRPLVLGSLNLIRTMTTRLPLPVTKFLSLLAAVVDTVGPIACYRLLRSLGMPRRTLDHVAPEHVRLYAQETFKTGYTDWLDRLSYPYVHYYSGKDVLEWFAGAGLQQAIVRPLGHHGWVGIGQASVGQGMGHTNGFKYRRSEA